VCDPVTVPEPFVSVTLPTVCVPSPQSMVAVWVSNTPTSVKEALALVLTLMWVGFGVTVRVTTIGATLLTMTVASVVPVAFWLSFTTTETLYEPLSL